MLYIRVWKIGTAHRPTNLLVGPMLCSLCSAAELKTKKNGAIHIQEESKEENGTQVTIKDRHKCEKERHEKKKIHMIAIANLRFQISKFQ
ncbi:hypothetical protein F5B20DRAFT_519224 [Whalleya microplaca]|nr:hypothetical protein F5B20DRAFT_519224 [Whalleya microplaca]